MRGVGFFAVKKINLRIDFAFYYFKKAYRWRFWMGHKIGDNREPPHLLLAVWGSLFGFLLVRAEFEAFFYEVFVGFVVYCFGD